MTEKKQTPIQGQVIGNEPENLESNQQKLAEKRLQTMNDLDKIKVPIMCTVIMDPEPFEYRNREFWMAFQKHDEKVREQLTQFLNSKKAKK